MSMSLWGATHVGRVRKNNEDAYALAPELDFAIVADGMGGAACGEVASEITVSEMQEFLRRPAGDEPLSPGELLKEGIRRANQSVRQAARDRPDCHGMGSTVVAAIWRDCRIWIANVGDSRAYRWRNGELQQLSYDQNVANELRTSLGFSEEQIAQYPQRNVLTMAIGSSEEMRVRIHEETPVAGDLYLLCSDGLSGPAGERGISEILAAGGDLETISGHLIQRALDRGGPDNITVVVLHWE